MTRKPTIFVTVLLLLILYVLQGVIIGFISAIPFYLDSRGAKWQEQGTFNFVFYPFSLKLAWAPIIDAVYISRFGRRKTWLVPIQCVIGITLFILSFYLNTLIEQVKINLLTLIFFFIYFLLASQDVCVDGWALTLLANSNLQWASTCQTVGQTIGRFIGFTILMTFESANFTNRFIRKPFLLTEKSSGLFTLDHFIRFWGIAFLVVSICIALFQREKEEDKYLNLCQTYLAIIKLFKKKCVRQLAVLFLISPIGYAATYAMTNLVLKR
jgi:PAT family acetyl-CoA transporter-like MFS transporter 1